MLALIDRTYEEYLDGRVSEEFWTTNGRRDSRKLATNGARRLRHTFCSHLAMRGAPARAIQELAGHQDLSTTERYMHLSPAAVESASVVGGRANPVPPWQSGGNGT